MNTTAAPTSSQSADRPFPPVAWLSSGALGLVIIGGILMASYAPRSAPLGVPTTLLCGGLVLLFASVILLVRLKGFAWSTFITVFKWALLAYVITAGMIEFAFVRDHTRGSPLLIVTLMLVVFALSVPIGIAFTTARFADPD